MGILHGHISIQIYYNYECQFGYLLIFVAVDYNKSDKNFKLILDENCQLLGHHLKPPLWGTSFSLCRNLISGLHLKFGIYVNILLCSSQTHG